MPTYRNQTGPFGLWLPTVYDLITTLADEYSHLESRRDFYQATAGIVRDVLDADVAVVSSERNRESRSIATAPRDWTDTDNLLSPVSLPQIAAAEGQAYIIDDKSNVRSAACQSSTEHGAAVEYPSLIWVPFGDGGFLLAGSREKAAFGDEDLDRLQAIRAIAALRHEWFDEMTNGPVNEETVEQAAAFLSHDARNLLEILRGRLQLAQETGDQDHLDSIEQKLDRLTAIIDDTVTVLYTGEHVNHLAPVSLEETAARAWGAVDVKRASLTTTPMEPFMADESRLCQLLENLFRNAVQHAGPDVTVAVGPLDINRGFYVEDDGPGIDSDIEPSLFNLGYTTDEAHTGVGLAIVERIAQAHQWEVSIQTSGSGGARFEFRSVERIEA